jgi:hypothetical protein
VKNRFPNLPFKFNLQRYPAPRLTNSQKKLKLTLLVSVSLRTTP